MSSRRECTTRTNALPIFSPKHLCNRLLFHNSIFSISFCHCRNLYDPILTIYAPQIGHFSSLHGFPILCVAISPHSMHIQVLCLFLCLFQNMSFSYCLISIIIHFECYQATINNNYKLYCLLFM